LPAGGLLQHGPIPAGWTGQGRIAMARRMARYGR
jgi:hypothetical protein